MTGSSLFDHHRAEQAAQNAAPEGKQFGERYRGRYHMPLLPGEAGTKSGGDWVPYGLMSATNLAGAITDTRELAIWERQRGQIGLALRDDLGAALTAAVWKAKRYLDSWDGLRSSDTGRALAAELDGIHEQARDAAGGSAAASKGTVRHNVWEERAVTGRLLGTEQINSEILALEKLLAEHGLVRLPGLQERVVRNTALNAAGRFDDIVMSVKTGRLYLADLKSKAKPYYSWLETWIQQAVYASAEYMLSVDKQSYEPGPLTKVEQDRSLLLRMPSDGSAPYLEKVDLEAGLRWAKLARQVVDVRSEAKSSTTFAGVGWSEAL